MGFLQEFQFLAAYLGLLLSIGSLCWHCYTLWSERRHRLVIIQRHEDFVNRVEQWDDGMTHIVLYAAIINNSLRTPVVICGYDLELQWKDDQFDWLLDPAESHPPGNSYSFPDDRGATSYSRDTILNHRLYGSGRLAPGDVIDGALLGRGYAPIPADYPHGSTIQMKFSVVDQDDKRHSKKCQFKVFKQPRG